MRCLLFALSFLFSAALSAQVVEDQDRIFYEHIHLNGETEALQSLLSRGSAFGMGVAAIGDLNGDGHTELAVGDPVGSGQLHILFMDSAANVLQSTSLRSDENGFDGKLTASGGFGSRVEALGDWDGDGIPDVAVGEPRGKLGVLMYGKVWLIFLNADGSAKAVTELHGRSPGLMSQLGRDRLFGHDIAALPDLDGNGQRDLLIGAPDLLAKGSGSAWVLLMDSPTTVGSVQVLEEGEGGLMTSLKRGDQFGFAVEYLGDLDNDGSPEVAISAPTDDESGSDEGAIYCLSLNQAGQVVSEKKWLRGQLGVQAYLEAEDRLGSSLARIDGLTSDSLPSLAIGAYWDDDGGKEKGAIYVWDLQSDGSIGSQHKISETSRNFEGKFTLGYEWAFSLNPLGDLNRDGRPDLLVSGNHHQVQGRSGSVWLLFPAAFPDRLRSTGTWAAGSGQFSAQDSAMLYANAETAEDSARVDSMYDLSSYAPNNLVFVLDVSASMNKPGRLPLLRDAFIELLAFMRPEDKISVITYSGKAILQLNGVPASEQEKIARTISGLKSLGDTKPAKALQLAYEQAEAHFIEGGNNRLIFATDGGFDFRELDKPLEKFASPRVPLSVFYFGKQPEWKLTEMNIIAQSGHGNSAYITDETVTNALIREIKTIRLKK